jgi:ABC-type multidrug transport system ATPase subunit
MSERILRALMQMFAIIAKVDGISNTGRSIVESFLKQQLNKEQVEKYLHIFDEYIEAQQASTKKKDGSAKRTSLNSVKVLKICTQINQELEQPQKVIVLIRLLEFIYSSDAISEQENEFVVTVADTFNISIDEFNQLRAFVEDTAEKVPNTPHILVINNKENGYDNDCKHIYCDALTSDIRVIQIDSVGMYALRIYGNIELQLNGQGISKGRVHILTPGSSLRSSKLKPIYYSDIIGRFLEDSSKARISFEAKNIDYKFKGGKLGLRNINIREESGKLIGIMGGSGAGKSTLLNVLNGVEVPCGGQVLINGKDIHKDPMAVAGVIGHVTQDDLLIEELTVYQNLFYNAKLCFGNLNDEEIAKKCHSLLADLGLTETKDLKVGSPLEKTISGGQRKRLNIGLELIREPSVLYVDEPTSGLSSRDSENIMDLLKELSLKGKLIFVVIHQPSSDIFKMFDKLQIIDVGGYPIYYGNPVDAVSYFKKLVEHVNADESECWNCGNVNPELIFNIIESKVLDEYGNLTHIRKNSPAEWNKSYVEKIESTIGDIKHQDKIPEAIFKIPNAFKQFKVFIIRDVLSKLTNTQYLLINFLEAPVLALVLAFLIRFYNTDADNKKGYIFRENENLPAYLFMSVVVALFIGLTVSAEEIIRDRKIRKRESFLNLSKASYLWSKITIMFALSAIQTFCFVIVGNSVLGVHGMLTDYWMVLFTTSCFANMLGLNISSAFNSAVTIYILIPFIIIPQLLLAGVVVKFDKLNPVMAEQGGVPLVGEAMASRWAYEALAVNQFKANKYEKNFYKYDKVISIAGYKKVYWIPKIEKVMTKIGTDLKEALKKSETEADFALIKNELLKEQTILNNKYKFENIDKLNAKDYTPEIAKSLKDFLAKINEHYINRENKYRTERDQLVQSMTKDSVSKANYMAMEDDYTNDILEQTMLNSNDLGERCLEKDGKLIQRIDPIFLDPTDSNIGRAHFLAPTKKFMGHLYSTFWFNLSVIWLMSISLMVMLYFDVFKRVLYLLGKINFKKRV